MLFLVELDHVKQTAPTTPEAGRAFIEHIIFPTIARAEQLMAEKKIAGGVTPLIAFSERREHVQQLLETLRSRP